MTRKSNARKARESKVFVSDQKVQRTAYAFFRAKWGNLSDEEICTRVALLSEEEREKFAAEVLARSVIQNVHIRGRIV